MQDMRYIPSNAVATHALAKKYGLHKSAAACERIIAKSFRKVPSDGLQTSSRAALLRITRAVAELRDDLAKGSGCAEDRLASVNTFLEWRHTGDKPTHTCSLSCICPYGLPSIMLH